MASILLRGEMSVHRVTASDMDTFLLYELNKGVCILRGSHQLEFFSDSCAWIESK